MFTEEEILILKKNLSNKRHPLWIKAFDAYNAAKDVKVHLGCRACYGKVLHFITQNNNTNVLHKTKETT